MAIVDIVRGSQPGGVALESLSVKEMRAGVQQSQSTNLISSGSAWALRERSKTGWLLPLEFTLQCLK